MIDETGLATALCERAKTAGEVKDLRLALLALDGEPAREVKVWRGHGEAVIHKAGRVKPRPPGRNFSWRRIAIAMHQHSVVAVPGDWLRL